MGEAYKLHIGMPRDVFLSDTSIPAFANFTIDAATDAVEFLMQSETNDAITHVGCRFNTVGATPGSYTIGIEGITGAPAAPDGTYKGATNNAKLSFTPAAGDAAKFKWRALGESFTPTRGELFFITIKPDALPTNSSTITTGIDQGIYEGCPRVTQNNAGSRTRLRNAIAFGYKTASRVYGRPIELITTVTFDSATTPDEAGIYFNIPTTFCSTFKVMGVRMLSRSPGANENITMQLYTGSAADPDPPTATAVIDGDAIDAAGSQRGFELYFTDTTLPTLSAGTAYRITLQPDTATADNAIARFDQPSGESANWEAWEGGTWFKYTSRTNAGNFTEDATQRPGIALILTDVTAPTSGGGLMTHPGMSGGMRG